VPALELLDRPLRHLLLLLVLEALALHTTRQLVGHICGRPRHLESYDDLRSEVVLRELGTDLHRELEPVACVLVNEGIEAEGSRVLSIDAIVHDEELTVGRVDRHRLHRFKVARVDTLMEVAVVEGHAAPFSRRRPTHCQVVVEN